MRVLAIHHKPFEAEGTVENALRERGAEITYIRAWKDDVKEIDPLTDEIVVVFGGPMGVYQADDFTFLKDEINFLEKRLAADLPTLGICLGSQLMAKALGAEVYKGTKGPEIGWCEITVNETGMQTPARHFDKSVTKMIQWHGDTFDFPDGATLLASSDKYTQIYSYGKNAMAVQCHPEVTEDILDYWLLIGGFDGLEKAGQDMKGFKAQTAEYMPTMKHQTELFIHEWLDIVLKEQSDA